MMRSSAERENQLRDIQQATDWSTDYTQVSQTVNIVIMLKHIAIILLELEGGIKQLIEKY